MPLILVDAVSCLIVLVRHQGIGGVVEVREFLLNGFLFDVDGLAFDAFDTIHFCLDEAAGSGGFGFLAGDDGGGQVALLIIVIHLGGQLFIVFLLRHRGTASGGGCARGGKDACCFTRSRF